MIKAVIFDMDGLLINSEPFWREAEKEVFALVNIHLTDEMCFKTVGLRIDEVVDYWHEQFPWSNYLKSDIRDRIIHRVIELVIEKGEKLPGVDQTIHFLKNKNLPLGIASASHHTIIKSVVKKLNLEQHFQVIHSAEKETFGKPHPAVYLSAAGMLGVKPHECLVFEDSFNGVIAARAARMKVIAVPEDIHYGEMHFHAANLILKTLEEFNDDVFAKLNND